ncbi:hypothetical protein [Metasolibacillus meyeri]|uniref:hypothetical protein n=1 Tax=Metasolibacillus meyeri TaxID=1071052 RepID=UPI000D31F225|nr:hypothetical protein [Metasolibacillus meyeri]
MRYFILLCALLFMTSCSNDKLPIENPPVEEQTNELQLFFKEDGSTAFFEGEGNEFASYTEQTFWLSSDYVHVRVDNGGVVINTVYRVTDTAIELVFQEAEDVAQFDATALDTYPVITTLLKAPIEVGQSEDHWAIADIAAQVDTPYRSFNNAVVVVMEIGNATETNYYVHGYGLVKSVIEIMEEYEIFIITSTLKELEVLGAD